jgi:hypothetical protein
LTGVDLPGLRRRRRVAGAVVPAGGRSQPRAEPVAEERTGALGR